MPSRHKGSIGGYQQKQIREEMQRRSEAWSAPAAEAGRHRAHTPNALLLAGEDTAAGHGAATIAGPGGHIAIGGQSPHRLDRGGLRGNAAPASLSAAVLPMELDGPLPREAKDIIAKALLQNNEGALSGSGDSDYDNAELYARRLLAIVRRRQLVQKELAAAAEEVTDCDAQTRKAELVVGAIDEEVARIDARMQELAEERNIVMAQRAEGQQRLERAQQRSQAAAARASQLRMTADTIAAEAARGQMLLGQLVPNLNIENYA